MSRPAPSLSPETADVLEGTARVVAVEGGLAWLEPEQTTACGGCKASKVCGVEPGSRRLVARRFSLPNDEGLTVGERVVVGITEGTVLRAAATAYGIPLIAMLAAGLAAQRLFDGGDLASAGAALAGLLVGLVLVRLRTGSASARGDHTPQFIRRATGPGPGGDCHAIDG